MELIAASIPMAPTHLQSYIRAMSTLDNVPRKEKPFYNFTANSLNLKNKHGSGIVSEIWKYLSDCRRNQVSTTTKNTDIGESAVRCANIDILSESGTNNALLEESAETNSAIVPEGGIKSDKNGVDVDKKIVKKKMKQAFKNANSKSLTIKALRKFVKDQFNKDEQMSVKLIIKKTIDQGKYFSQEGNTITMLK